ncbi:MAG: nucleotidyl transferase AbiEii/AbiGii toxin family protein [Chloroflexi bacterium]|nr:nucleotidyl transferase AbiEii/AbiGii toxin family protein [Chloroflexota bacterium]
MKVPRTRNLAASVRQRLLNLARETGEPFDLVLTRYALERLLYRLSQSVWRDRFTLKGAMLFSLWFGAPHRPTRDLDLLGFGENDAVRMLEVFTFLCRVEVEEDGISFLSETVRATEILEDNEYGGVRVQLSADLAGARIPVQVDIGFGDPVTPQAEEITFPVMLEFPAPVLRAASKYTVVAEKFQIMVIRGIANSRMKDFFDIWMMSQRFAFRGLILGQALRATFERRNTPLRSEIPLALTTQFFDDFVKKAQWEAFIRKNKLSSEGSSLANIVESLGRFLMPPLVATANRDVFDFSWPAGGPWGEI